MVWNVMLYTQWISTNLPLVLWKMLFSIPRSSTWVESTITTNANFSRSDPRYIILNRENAFSLLFTFSVNPNGYSVLQVNIIFVFFKLRYSWITMPEFRVGASFLLSMHVHFGSSVSKTRTNYSFEQVCREHRGAERYREAPPGWFRRSED